MAQAKLQQDEHLRQLLADLATFFNGRGLEAYLVGGFLRDTLLGRDCRDIDISVAADTVSLGRELADSLGGHFFPLGADRPEDGQVVRILLPDDGLHIDLKPLRDDIKSELRRRDYTIDAMALPLSDGPDQVGEPLPIIDPCGGQADLRQRLVRVISEDALHRDPLRLLRGVRLSAQTSFRLEPTTAALIRSNGHRLTEAAPERQRDELMRILAVPRAAPAIRQLDELGLLSRLLPEVEAARGVEQPKEHTWDVFNHLLEAVGRLDMLLAAAEPEGPGDGALWRELWQQLAWLDLRSHFQGEVMPERPRAAVLKLTALLHDIAKPQTKTLDESGRIRFFGHDDVGAEVASLILGRLRFSTREVEMVSIMIANHLRPVQLGQEGPPSRRALYRYYRDCGDVAIDLLFLSMADHLATAGPRVNMDRWRDHVSLVNYILAKRFQEEEIVAPPRLVTGHDLMTELGLTPSPIVGQLLEAIREAQAAGLVSDRDGAVALARQEMVRLERGTAAVEEP